MIKRLQLVCFHIGAHIKPSVDNCPQLRLRPLSMLGLDIRADMNTAM